ncbi:hypothetical protein DF3PA_100114 [Candidatus Defluviicoccus seviourii]|uniref:Uncharacterized protein n=2 Tax=root TaxID=1 RepID=A0A564WBB6_9PROT|nr:hypothetical protein DF3PB_2050004 [uncultured Defluviicoccus sp.]VUX45266.1 hypothetical protein DF3PA_100114 [Candidatus Defluviicoccus seviourii]
MWRRVTPTAKIIHPITLRQFDRPGYAPLEHPNALVIESDCCNNRGLHHCNTSRMFDQRAT